MRLIDADKMRLIDADAIIDRIDENIPFEYSEYANGLADAIQMIANAPTVEAIPIEWEKKWLDNCDTELFGNTPISTYCDGYQNNVIECLLNSWEKVNY